jgi:hypothetical protein
MKTNSTPPGIGQWALALTFLGISLGGAGASLYINYTFGAQFGPIAAGIFAGGEICLFVVPFTKGSLGWNPRRRALWVGALALSLTAASFHILQIFEERTKEVSAVAAKVGSAKGNEHEARAELKSITETQSVAALDALVKSAAQATAEAEADAKAHGISCIQRKKCREAADKRDKLTARLGIAQRRDKLERQLEKAQDTISTTPEQSMAGAATIAAWLQISEAEVSANISIWIMALSILLLVMASGFSGDAGQMLTTCWSARKASRPAKPRASAPVVRSAPADTSGKMTKAQALKLTQAFIWQCPGAQTDKGVRELAEMLGVAKSTYAEWLKSWKQQGKIIEVGFNGTRTIIQAPKMAA